MAVLRLIKRMAHRSWQLDTHGTLYFISYSRRSAIWPTSSAVREHRHCNGVNVPWARRLGTKPIYSIFKASSTPWKPKSRLFPNAAWFWLGMPSYHDYKCFPAHSYTIQRGQLLAIAGKMRSRVKFEKAFDMQQPWIYHKMPQGLEKRNLLGIAHVACPSPRQWPCKSSNNAMIPVRSMGWNIDLIYWTVMESRVWLR